MSDRTAKDDHDRLMDIKYHLGRMPDGHIDYDPEDRRSILSMRDAVEIADGRENKSGLSKSQIKIVNAVKEMRKTPEGRQATYEAARDGAYAAMDDNPDAKDEYRHQEDTIYLSDREERNPAQIAEVLSGKLEERARPNITDDYDQERLARVEKIIQSPREEGGDIQRDEIARNSTISMRDAIDISEGRKSGANLRHEQRVLVEVVEKERETEVGRALTDAAAEDGEWLAVDNNNNWGGMHNERENLTIITAKDEKFGFDRTNDINSMALTLHHEMVHHEQQQRDLSRPPEDLSSYDKKLWYLGNEGQAHVAKQDELRRTQGLPPLTDEQKRHVFESYPQTEGYSEHYDLKNVSRHDGRQLTMEEYEQAFGAVPGHEEDGNYLKGHYGDPAEIYNEEYHFADAKKEAEKVPYNYEELPEATEERLRFEPNDGRYVVYVKNEDGGKPEVEYYARKEMPDGSKKYIKRDPVEIKRENGDTLYAGTEIEKNEGYDNGMWRMVVTPEGKITDIAEGNSKKVPGTEKDFEWYKTRLPQRHPKGSIRLEEEPAPDKNQPIQVKTIDETPAFDPDKNKVVLNNFSDTNEGNNYIASSSAPVSPQIFSGATPISPIVSEGTTYACEWAQEAMEKMPFKTLGGEFAKACTATVQPQEPENTAENALGQNNDVRFTASPPGMG